MPGEYDYAIAGGGSAGCTLVARLAENDPGAVLDDQLRVRSVESLRVCDASAMPTQITGNLNATVITMAEKAADMILQREPLPPEDPGNLS